jgi:iron complex transport system permease protein
VIGVALVGLLIGPAGLDPGAVILGLLDAIPFVEIDHGLSSVEQSVLFEIRFPRVVLGGIVGAVLAVAGAAYQGVFRRSVSPTPSAARSVGARRPL